MDHTTAVEPFFSELDRCYDCYLSRNNIEPDQQFFILKFLEELGELAALLIAVQGKHPKISRAVATSQLSEEAADLLCQTIILVRRLNLDVWPIIKKKWLEQSDAGGST